MPNTALEKIIKLPDSQKVTVVILLIAAMLFSYIYYIFIPQRELYSTHLATLVNLQAKNNEQQSILANLPRFKQELKVLQLAFDDALKMLPNAREIPNLITSISTFAQESGLEINLFQPKPEVAMDFYAQIPVDMKVTGQYNQIGIFFDKLSKLPRIINIEDLALIAKKIAKSNSILLDASFKATTFKFIEQSGATNAGKKK